MRSFPWILIGVVVIAVLAFGVVGLILAGLGALILYLITVRTHPRMRHTGWRSCNGTGEIRHPVFPWMFHKCGNCQGGRRIRWGAGHWGPEHIQREYHRNREARATAKKTSSWR